MFPLECLVFEMSADGADLLTDDSEDEDFVPDEHEEEGGKPEGGRESRSRSVSNRKRCCLWELPSFLSQMLPFPTPTQAHRYLGLLLDSTLALMRPDAA